MEIFVLKYLIMFSIFISSSLEYAKTIIFDLHGVLLERSTSKTASKLGYIDCGRYTLFSGYSLEERCEELLGALPQHELKDVKLKGQSLPKPIGEWLKGEKKAEDMIKEINNFFDKSKHLFKSDLEDRLIRSVIDLMAPKNLAYVVQPIQDMSKLVQECKKQKDKSGKPKHNLLILSNWDKESFPLIKKNCKSVFKHFDDKHIIISADVKLLKPEAELFNHIIKKFKLDPKDCVFIDDQEENVAAAKKAGIEAIHHKDYKTTRQKFIDLDIIETKKKK